MKSLFTSVLTFLTFFSLWAQAPESVNYQAVARNSTGDLIINTNLNVRFTIRSGSAGGASVYQETHFANTNDFGLFTAAIGDGTPVSGTFASINWSGNSYYLQVEVDPGSGYVDLGATQLLSVPYALHAKSVSGGLAGTGAQNRLAKFTSGTAIGNSTLFDNGTNVGVGTTNPLQQFTVGGPTSAIMVGFAGSFNNVESGRLIFNEDVNDAGGTCGFEFFHNGATNELTLSSGCPTMDTIVRFTRALQRTYFKGNVRFGSVTQVPTNPVSVAGSADISGRLGIGVTSAVSDIHILQSGGVAANQGTGGVNLENGVFHWRIYNSNNFLRFNYSDNSASTYTAKSYINPTDGSYNMVSDATFKRDLEPLGSVLEGVLKLNPLKYYYIDNVEGSKKSMGFLAQEVEKIFPETVSQENEEAILGIDYSKFAIISIKAIQEQQQEIDTLRKELDELRQMVRDMDK